MSNNLPLVGAQAVLSGLALFDANSRHLQVQLYQINRATAALANDSERHWNKAAQAVAHSSKAIGASIAIITAAASAAAVGVGIAATKIAADMETRFNTVGAITGETSGAVGKLSEAADEMSRRVNVSMSSAAEAALELGRAGVTLETQLGGALRATVDLATAAAGEVGLEQAARAVAAGLNNYGKAAENAGKPIVTATDVTDALTAAAQSSNLSFQGVIDAFTKVGPVAAQHGLTIKETAAAVAILGKANLSGSESGTALRNVFLRLDKPSAQAAKVMERFGINLYDAAGAARPFRDVLHDLQVTFGEAAVQQGKLTEQTRNEALAILFETRARTAAQVLIEAGVKAYDELLEAMDRVTATNLAVRMLQPTNAQFEILKNNITNNANAFGAQLLPAIRNVISGVTEFLRGLGPIFSALGAITSILISGAGFYELDKAMNKITNNRAAIVLQALLSIVQQVRGELERSIIPALGGLAKAIDSAFGTDQPMVDFLTAVQNINNVIRAISLTVELAIISLTNFVNWLVTTEKAASVLRIALIAIATVPLAGLALILAPFIASLATSLAAATALGVGIALVITNADKLASVIHGALNTSLGTFNGHIVTAASVLKAGLEPAIVLVTAALTVMALRFAATALAAVVNAGIVAVAWTVTLPKQMLAASVSIIGSLARMILPFAAVAVAATVASVRIVAAWTVALLPAIVGAAAAISASAGTVILILGAIAAASVALHNAWNSNFLGIQDATKGVLKVVAEALANFIEFLKSTPLGEFIDTTIAGFRVVQDFAGSVAGKIGDVKGEFDALHASVVGYTSATTNARGQSVSLTNAFIQEESAARSLAEAEAAAAAAQAALQAALNRLKVPTTEAGDDVNQLADSLKNVREKAEKVPGAIINFNRALEQASELIQDLSRAIQNASEKALSRLTILAQETGRKINESIQEAAQDIEKAIIDAGRKIKEAEDQLLLGRANRARRDALDEELRIQAKARDERIDNEEFEHRHILDLNEKFHRDRIDGVIDAERERIDALRRARSIEAEDEEIAHKRNLEDIERRRKQREGITKNIGGNTSDAQRAAERARAAGFNVGAPKGEQLDPEKEIARRRKLEDDERARRRTLDEAERIRKRDEDIKLDNIRRNLAQEEEVRKREVEVAEFERRKTATLDRESFDKDSRARVRQFEDTLEDEALIRQKERIREDRDTRIAEINAALAEREARIKEAAAREAAEVIGQLQHELDAVGQRLIDQAEDIASLGGVAILPVLEDINNNIMQQIGSVQESAKDAALALGFLVGNNGEATPLPNGLVEGIKGAMIGISDGFDHIADGAELAVIRINKALGTLGTDKPITMKYGGIVPGRMGAPVSIIAHGGERYMGMNSSLRSASMVAPNVNRSSSVVNHYSYKVDANYAQVESPVSIEHDLQALIMLSSR